MKHTPEFLAMAEEARKRIRELSPDVVKALVREGAVVIDVRDKEELEEKHFAGAVNISRGTLEMRISEVVLDRNACSIAGGLLGYESPENDQ